MKTVAALVAALAVAACGERGASRDGGTAADAGVDGGATPRADGGFEDGGPRDSGFDAGNPDAGADAGPRDAGSGDGGAADAGGDAGAADAGADGGAPVDAGFCGHPAGTEGVYAFCAQDADCACPYACNPDDPPFGFSGAVGSVCEIPCRSSADCTDALTACQRGFCAYDLCDVSRTFFGLPPNGTVGGPCSAGDGGDGTCVVVDDPRFGQPVALCREGGGADAGCDLAADRAAPGLLCTVGSVCVAVDAGTAGTCRPACDPADGGLCAAGTTCCPLDSTGTFPAFGACG